MFNSEAAKIIYIIIIINVENYLISSNLFEPIKIYYTRQSFILGKLFLE